MPYSSPKPKASRKGKKTKTASPTQLRPSAIFALNIWQYSMLNHTWSRRTAASPPPQGTGAAWPISLCGCLVGEDVACIALGREDGTCVWALDLHCAWRRLFVSTCMQSLTYHWFVAWTWTEIPGALPPGSSVFAMSAVGTTAYFMGDSLASNSPIVHCDMSLYAVCVV